ncbi:hypothetical protein THERMOT_1909 [Bathymodiolus thermophilus thioautotrophic gill symbiont]|uniref:Uncharacterized protein n=1 Tax=Bathymodiolus thermophilus thioautotrophic gill symbiont TaxID=2360 RepID=A0A8H8XBG6_9GAMM|nr:hypothetical protein THERMOS_699 [Bathymodiolus thermophilus thioautotrophic gill symbiont]CAB5504123.1 hypothetical protein THERMOT_1909 [Bathymodiolus thermophilus thioautotrophic gill symbiont]
MTILKTNLAKVVKFRSAPKFCLGMHNTAKQQYWQLLFIVISLLLNSSMRFHTE